MRAITLSEFESWVIPDLNAVFPANDLWLEHTKTGEVDGATDSVVIDGRTYKSIFYSEKARYYIGDDYKYFTGKVTEISIVIASGVTVNLWNGIIDKPRQLPAVLFDAGNFLSMIQNPILATDFNVECDGLTITKTNLANIEITELTGDYAQVWIGESPSAFKMIRVIKRCTGYKKVGFILQNGEFRTWYLYEKRKNAEYLDEAKKVIITEGVFSNTSTREVSDGSNKITTTLYISGLTKSELDEISQLAVSRYVEVDGVQVDVIRRSAVISGNSRGGVFTIDVKGSL